MAKQKIFISKRTGNIVALCDDIIDNIPDLGPKKIQRKANVEFDNASGNWVISELTGEVLGVASRRSDAIDRERELMNERIKGEMSNK